MKKKLFLALSIVAILACIFAISVSAVTPNNDGETYISADNTTLALYDTDGNALAWFYDSTTEEYVPYRVEIDFTCTLGDGKEIHTDNKTLNDTDDDSTTTFPYSLSDMILLNGRDYEAFTYISGTWKDLPLEAIYVNSNFQYIDMSAFNSDTNIRVFDIPETHNASKLHFGETCFLGASNLQEIFIPKNAYFENESQFRATGIKTVKFASDFAGTEIKPYAFYNCKSLTGNVVLPNTITTIGKYAFAFDGNVSGNNLSLSITLPSALKSVGEKAFQHNNSLVEVKFTGTSLKAIDSPAFENCKALTSIDIPEGVTTLGNCLFKNCSSLESVSFPTTLTTINGDHHFWGTNLTKVIGLENTKITRISTYMFRGLKNWKPEKLILPNTVESIGENGLADIGMKELVLGSGLKSMASGAITGCTSLTTIYVPAGLDTLYLSNSTAKLIFVTSTDEDVLNGYKADTGFTTNIVTYEDYAANPSNYLSGKYIISGYNFCEAFYQGVHAPKDAGTIKFTGDKYTSSCICEAECSRNCGKPVIEQICGALFENKGYSKAQDGTSFTYGIAINDENIAAYVDRTGNNAFNYGFIVGAVPANSTGAIINAKGESLLEKSIIADFASVDYDNFTIYNVKIVGIETAEQKSQAVYCCAYIIDNGAVTYMGETVSSTASTISSDTITVIEATTPSINEEE